VRLSEFFLPEGAQDTELRVRADQAFEGLKREIESSPQLVRHEPESRQQYSQDEDVLFRFKGSRSESLPDDLDVVFVVTAQKSGNRAVFQSFKDGRKSTIAIYLRYPRRSVDSVRQDPKRADAIFSAPTQWLSQYKSDFVHEYIHYIDKTRAPQAQRGSHGLKPDEYYNDPFEQNALMQELFSEFEQQLQKLDPTQLDALKQMDGNAFYQFFIGWLKMNKHPFERKMNGDTERRLKKRVARFWQDLKQRELR
jgi:hypothetical protein